MCPSSWFKSYVLCKVKDVEKLMLQLMMILHSLVLLAAVGVNMAILSFRDALYAK